VNQLHWCLDVGFHEDESRVRSDHGPENIALLRKIAMNIPKSERSHKRGVQAKRKPDAYVLSQALVQARLSQNQGQNKMRSPWRGQSGADLTWRAPPH
jgi:hypothetical protein